MHMVFYLLIFFFFVDPEIPFFFLRKLKLSCSSWELFKNRLPGVIGSSKVNVCQCYQGYSVTGLSVPLLKVLVN